MFLITHSVYLACWWVKALRGKALGCSGLPCLSPFLLVIFSISGQRRRKRTAVKRDGGGSFLFIFLGCHFFLSILRTHSGSRGSVTLQGCEHPTSSGGDVTLRARCTCSVLLNSHRVCVDPPGAYAHGTYLYANRAWEQLTPRLCAAPLLLRVLQQPTRLHLQAISDGG